MHIIQAIKGRQLKIDFDPEVFGLRTNAFGKEVPIKGIKFNDFLYMTEDDEVVNRLQQHPGNQANGGGSFRIESSQATREMLDATGTVSLTSEDNSLSDKDRDVLLYVSKNKDDIPEDRSKIIDNLEYLIERFGISAIRVPHIKSKDSRIMLVAYEVLDLLSEHNIWPEANSKFAFAALDVEDEEVSVKPEKKVKNDRKRNNGKGQALN